MPIIGGFVYLIIFVLYAIYLLMFHREKKTTWKHDKKLDREIWGSEKKPVVPLLKESNSNKCQCCGFNEGITHTWIGGDNIPLSKFWVCQICAGLEIDDFHDILSGRKSVGMFMEIPEKIDIQTAHNLWVDAEKAYSRNNTVENRTHLYKTWRAYMNHEELVKLRGGRVITPYGFRFPSEKR